MKTWNFAICRRKEIISRYVAENFQFRDLLRKNTNFAIRRGKCKFRDYVTTAINKWPWSIGGIVKGNITIGQRLENILLERYLVTFTIHSSSLLIT